MNTLIYGFHWKSQEDAIAQLEADGLISVKFWIGKRKYNDIVLDSFIQGKVEKKPYRGINADLYETIFQEIFPTYLDMMSRNPNQALATYQELLNTFNVQFDYISQLLSDNAIELVIYQNMPHMGNDLILYTIAKHTGVKTLMIYQTIIPNRFCYITDMKDFGTYDTSKVHFDYPHQSVEFSQKKTLFYMKNIEIKSKSCNYNLFYDTLKYLIGSNTRRSFIAIMKRYADCLQYKYNYNKYKVDDLDDSKKFVYFPLQLQPEMSTSTLGGIYSDQLLAIEKVSKMIPEDWYIYVKENPKQLEKFRGKEFFKRLTRIPNVKYIAKTVNSFDLIEKCQFVANIAGTVGWEAIRSDKCCLIFGKIWYQKFDGIFLYEDRPTYEEIMAHRIDKEQVEKDYNTFLQKTGNGIVDKAYIASFQEFDEGENTKNLTQSLEKIIKSM